MLDLTVKTDPAGWAGRLGGIVLPTGSVRLDTHQTIPELAGYADGGMVGAGRRRRPPGATDKRPGPGRCASSISRCAGFKSAQLAGGGG